MDFSVNVYGHEYNVEVMIDIDTCVVDFHYTTCRPYKFDAFLDGEHIDLEIRDMHLQETDLDHGMMELYYDQYYCENRSKERLEDLINTIDKAMDDNVRKYA